MYMYNVSRVFDQIIQIILLVLMSILHNAVPTKLDVFITMLKPWSELVAYYVLKLIYRIVQCSNITKTVISKTYIT